MHVLGTAGHVDHGKSSLVQALTGIDPDRLPEEKERGLTIDLGFAWFETEAGPLGVVDVPGHERFVRTMIAGVGGIDLVLFVVAADDGWMPQTQEHLDILRLLDVHTGVIAVTKTDLVDKDWLALVQEDIHSKTRGTFLEGAAIVPTAATQGVGIDELRAAIASAQRQAARKQDIGRGRLAVDRVFTIAGQGTVVTGTLRDGPLHVDRPVYLFPGERPVRLRGLQTHKQTLNVAAPGSRVAANLAATEKDDVKRGDWLFAEEPVALPRFIGAELELLPNLPFPLKPGTPLLVVFGTSEIPAKLVSRDSRPLVPGSRNTIQLDLRRPLCARFGDRFIVRLPSPQITVGGGRFLAPSARRYTTSQKEKWSALERLTGGEYADWVVLTLREEHQLKAEALYPFYPGDKAGFESLLDAGEGAGRWRRLSGYVVNTEWWKTTGLEIAASVQAYHQAHPSETGPASVEVLTGARVPEALQATMLKELEAHGVRSEGPYLCHQTHRAGLTPAQKTLAEAWRKRFAAQPYAPPTRAELLSDSPEARATLEFLLKSGEWTELKDGIVLRTEDYERALRTAVEMVTEKGALTVGDFRDRIGTTRKYALPILDRCDRLGYTKRAGDDRVAGPRASELHAELGH